MLKFMNQLYDYFIGQWHFHRKITPHGYAKGIVNFSPISESPNRLHYLEQGQFSLENQHDFNFQREYIYEIKENHVYIYHARGGHQGDFFIHLAFTRTSSEAKASHLCGKDDYQAQFSFIDMQSFKIQYQVKGPQKNYHIQTQYFRNDL